MNGSERGRVRVRLDWSRKGWAWEGAGVGKAPDVTYCSGLGLIFVLF